MCIRLLLNGKPLQHKFTGYILEWLKEFYALTENKEAWFYPPLRGFFTERSAS